MKTIKEQFKHLNKGLLLSICVGIFLPLIYSFLRTMFIIDHGSNSYAMASYWLYIQIFSEMFAALLILPLFSFTKEKQGKKNFSILIGVILILFFLLLLLFSLTSPLLNSMENLNSDDDITKTMLRNFLWISMLSGVLIIYEQFLMADVITEGNNNKIYIFTAISLILKISLDLLFLAPFSPISYSINNIIFSQLLSSLIIVIFLQIAWYISYKKQNEKISFSKGDLFNYYKKGFVPFIENFIRNFFYIFVTLKIVNSLGETEWNSWNLAAWVYWSMLFKVTTTIEYFLLSERINNENIDKRKTTLIFVGINSLIFIIFGPILIIFALPLVVNESEWLHLTRETSWIMLPFMLLLSTQIILRTKFLTENKLKYILINTIITNFLIYFPVYILLLSGINISYTWNLIIWVIAMTLTFSITAFQFEFLNKVKKKEKTKQTSSITFEKQNETIYADKNDNPK